MPRRRGTTALKILDSAVCNLASVAFNTIQFFNKHNPNPAFIPKWSDKPMLKSWEKSKPPLGWPRTTDSLCPECVKEARKKVIDGEMDWTVLAKEKVGVIKADIIERDGQIWMVKDCPRHGHFEDIIAKDSQFLEWAEKNFPGRDIASHNDEELHCFGVSNIKYGRGSVLTIDLTNRCNMMCDPCFMDANQVGYVHELSWDDIESILRNGVEMKPRRQMSVQFSGGEPTLSPHFLRAVKLASDLGYNSIQAATNGIEFAKSKDFCRQAAEAGLRYVYFQFDGIGNDANCHRHIGNLFDVKLRAIENLHEAGVEIVLVTTLINTVNNDQVGPIIRFAMQNPKKVAFVAFQPVSFTGRDEDVTPERRLRQRYTLCDMAYDVKKQVGITEPIRDWFPLSLMNAFVDFADLVHGPDAKWGQVNSCSHPNCGVGTALMVNKETGEAAPVPKFLNIPGLIADITKITDAARGKGFSNFMMALALLKNYRPFGGPASLSLLDILKKFDKSFALSGKHYGTVGAKRTLADIEHRRQDPWNFLFIAGMHFMDLWNYDFRRTEMCCIPYGTQKGEVPFCAYNTGLGWRNVIEHLHQNASVADWYKDRERHTVYAGGKPVVLDSYEHSLRINPEDAARVRPKTELPQTAHDEGRRMKTAVQRPASGCAGCPKEKNCEEELVESR